MIEVNDNMLGVWFVSWKNKADWMAAVWRTPQGAEGRYRFRYYKDEKAFDSDDEKSWYSCKSS